MRRRSHENRRPGTCYRERAVVGAPKTSIFFRGAVLAAIFACVACGRTGVGVDTPSPTPAAPPAVDTEDDAGVDAGEVVPVACTPSEETCNGADDDCDGRVDEVPPEPCAGGGARLCVAGRMSACPRRCEVCVPGSRRVCFLNYCTFWGVQDCSADGRSFGPCREPRAPPECIDIALDQRDSPELEQCCIDSGRCCLDRHDLDGDGDRRESLGTCDDVLCE